jgi:hypothetical protein
MIEPEPKSRAVVVSCEAGGAQILSSWVRDVCPEGDYSYCLQGPAEAIFRTKLGKIRQVELAAIRSLHGPFDRIITSTSWVPDLERTAIAIAKEKGIRSISVLDHWTNYRERFLPLGLWGAIGSDWIRYLPDEVWVCDNYAFTLAARLGFPAERLVQIENPYLSAIRREIKQRKATLPIQKPGLCILYLSEPVADDLEKTYGDANYWGYTEYDLVQALVEDVNLCLQEGLPLSVRIRLHPNEVEGKYDTLLKMTPAIHLSPNVDLLDDLMWADAIMGGESMGLIIALLTEKPVFSVIPESDRKQCALPHQEILRVEGCRQVVEVLMNLTHRNQKIKFREENKR